MWKRNLEHVIQDYMSKDRGLICEVVPDISSGKRMILTLYMMSRKEIESSDNLMRAFLEDIVGDLVESILEGLDETNNYPSFPALSICVSEVNAAGGVNHPQKNIYKEGVRINIQYFPRMIPIPSRSNGTMIITR